MVWPFGTFWITLATILLPAYFALVSFASLKFLKNKYKKI